MHADTLPNLNIKTLISWSLLLRTQQTLKWVSLGKCATITQLYEVWYELGYIDVYILVSFSIQPKTCMYVLLSVGCTCTCTLEPVQLTMAKGYCCGGDTIRSTLLMMNWSESFSPSWSSLCSLISLASLVSSFTIQNALSRWSNTTFLHYTRSTIIELSSIIYLTSAFQQEWKCALKCWYDRVEYVCLCFGQQTHLHVSPSPVHT